MSAFPIRTATAPEMGDRIRGLRCLLTCLALASSLSGLAGCAAFHPVRGVPAVYVPEDYLGEERSGRETINLSLLVRNRPEQHRIEAGDLLAVFIPGILGSVHHTDASSGENPPISNPLGEHQLPTIGYPILVQDDHSIALPYLPPINLYGLTTEQAAERIRQTALSLGILRSELGKDRVLVTLQQPRQYRILVVRQEATSEVGGGSQPGSLNMGTSKRGTAQLVSLPAYENDVLHALMGNRGNTGLPGLDAKNFIYVIRGRRGSHAGVPAMGAGPGQVMPPQMGMPIQSTYPGQMGVPQQWNGGVMPPQGVPYPQPSQSMAPNPYGQSSQGMIIRGQSDIMPVGYWTPGEHQRQLQQLERPQTWGHSINNVSQTTPPVWSGNSPMPVPTPSPLSGSQMPAMSPNPLSVQPQDVPLLHPSLGTGFSGHSVAPQMQPANDPPLRVQAPEVPLLHPSLAPQSAGSPVPVAPAPQPTPATGDPRLQVAPTYAPEMQWQQGTGAGQPAYGAYPPTSSGYIDPAIQQMAAMQGTPYDRQWASTLGNWSPTVESQDVIKIPVRLAQGEMPYITEEDITLYDGDIVFIESRDSEVFYTGGLLGGGQYTLPRDNDLTVTQAVSIASSRGNSGASSRSLGGVSALNQDVSISASRVVVLRTLPCGQRVQIEVDIYKAFCHQDEDIIIQPGDMILLQYKCHEAVFAFVERYLLEGALLGIAAGTLNGGSNSGN